VAFQTPYKVFPPQALAMPEVSTNLRFDLSADSAGTVTTDFKQLFTAAAVLRPPPQLIAQMTTDEYLDYLDEARATE
jgi:hypothetical protein